MEVAYGNENDLDTSDSLALPLRGKAASSPESDRHGPALFTRQRSTSASGASSATITSLNALYGTAI